MGLPDGIVDVLKVVAGASLIVSALVGLTAIFLDAVDGRRDARARRALGG